MEEKDGAITARVKEHFAKDAHLKKADISVQTNAGVVSLIGEVKDIAMSAHASWTAWFVTGVKSVKNDLTVKRRPRGLSAQQTRASSAENRPQWCRRTAAHRVSIRRCTMKETNLSRTTAQQREVTSYASPTGEKTGQMAQAFKRAAVDHHHIAQRAYELYEQRDRQDGQDLEDWLKAEHELAGSVSRK